QKLPDTAELAKRLSPIDTLKQDDAPPGTTAVLGDARFRLPNADRGAWITQDRDGKVLAGGAGQSGALFHPPSGGLPPALTGANGRVFAIAINSDGRYLAGGNLWDNTVKVWDLETGEVTATLKGHAAGIWSVAFTPDGTRLVSAGEDAVKVWDLKTGQVSR